MDASATSNGQQQHSKFSSTGANLHECHLERADGLEAANKQDGHHSRLWGTKGRKFDLRTWQNTGHNAKLAPLGPYQRAGAQLNHRATGRNRYAY